MLKFRLFDVKLQWGLMYSDTLDDQKIQGYTKNNFETLYLSHL